MSLRTCALCFCAVMPAHLEDHAARHGSRSVSDIESSYVPMDKARPSAVPKNTNTPIREDEA